MMDALESSLPTSLQAPIVGTPAMSAMGAANPNVPANGRAQQPMAPPMGMMGGAMGMMMAQQQSVNPFEVLTDAQLAQYQDAQFGRHAVEASRGGDVPRIWRVDRKASHDKDEEYNEADDAENQIDTAQQSGALDYADARDAMDESASQWEEGSGDGMIETSTLTAGRRKAGATVEDDENLGRKAAAQLYEAEGETNDGQPLDWDGVNDGRFASVPSEDAADIDTEVDAHGKNAVNDPDREQEKAEAEDAAHQLEESDESALVEADATIDDDHW
jgi:hypothetical protein